MPDPPPPPLSFENPFSVYGHGKIFLLFSKVVEEWLLTAASVPGSEMVL